MYIEIAVSDGPGTLVNHQISPIDDLIWQIRESSIAQNWENVMFTTLTNAECQDFIAMHGGTVAT